MKKSDIDFGKSGKFFKFPNKYWEIELSTFEDTITIFNLHFECNKNCDHAGLHLTVEILSLFFSFQIYDSRHWDFDTKTYMKY